MAHHAILFYIYYTFYYIRISYYITYYSTTVPRYLCITLYVTVKNNRPLCHPDQNAAVLCTCINTVCIIISVLARKQSTI